MRAVLRRGAYDDVDVVDMTTQVQAEYGVRYGGSGDVAPIAVDEFAAPHGYFVVAAVDGESVAMGGWRRGGPDGEGDAEIKRMYVRPTWRGQGLSRVVLADLERSAADAGVVRLVLETGRAQPEAIALYRSCGYTDVEPFGFYASSPLSVHLAKTIPR
ncbi:GNAT family N-acetyltransferase [Aeromicrobium sp. CF4.19]|uniref:GNAT family N-acetyltransferase n=1 Tax=Aeromicrobium sp. CF4.19 TaxID=3373082 RepID=UPI003EE68DCB